MSGDSVAFAMVIVGCVVVAGGAAFAEFCIEFPAWKKKTAADLAAERRAARVNARAAELIDRGFSEYIAHNMAEEEEHQAARKVTADLKTEGVE